MNDTERIAELSTQLGYPATAEEVRERLSAICSRDDHDFFVAALPDGDVAGWAHVYVRRPVMLDPLAEVEGLVVDERHRRTGIGRTLMNHVEQWARVHGCHIVNLRSNVIREEAHGFYLRLGYDEVKHQKVFRKLLR